ncbi:MAG: YibE/F family protein [Clostridia bacterium]|nr:YibE/F family protein [Clostridia bacterium]
MKKWTFFGLMVILIFSVVFATENIEEDYEYYIDENYDYSLGYNEGDIIGDDTVYENALMKGVVVEAGEVYNYKSPFSDLITPVQDVKVKIRDEKMKDKVLDIQYSLAVYEDDVIVTKPLKTGNKVYVYANFENGEMVGEASIAYVDKQGAIIWLSLIYAALILLIGRMKGLKALVSLIITVVAFFAFTIPQIFAGANALGVTILTAIVVTILTLIIISGFNKKTLAAIIGTTAGIVLAGILAIVFGNTMRLTGVDEDSYMLTTAEIDTVFNFENIMFAGIIIGALGACMDVGMSLASAMYELKQENPEITKGRLFKAGMNIGKDMMGTMTNTLILAYIGSSTCSILLFMGFKFQLFEILNQERIGEQILRSLAGSIGLVCTIPLTALVCSVLYNGKMKKENDYGRE